MMELQTFYIYQNLSIFLKVQQGQYLAHQLMAMHYMKMLQHNFINQLLCLELNKQFYYIQNQLYKILDVY